AGVAELADDAVALLLLQGRECFRERWMRIAAGLDETIEVEVVPLHQTSRRALLGNGQSGVREPRQRLAAGRQLGVCGQISCRRHSLDPRIDAADALVIEQAEPGGDRRKALVDRITTEEQAVLRA